jgi:shikimate dehydrogenase
MKHFAVIGNPIDHSLSPKIHQQFAAQLGLSLTYEKILTNEHEFSTTVSHFFDQGGTGLNITMPFKTQAFNLAKIRTPRCQQAKAANTLWMDKGILHADTTDGVGIISDLSHHLTLNGKQVLVLGAGGASRSIIGPLLAANIAGLTLVNRTAARAEAVQIDFPQIKVSALTDLNASYDLIINTASTSFSTFPPGLLAPSTLCYDLAYNIHEPTPFVTWARQQGCAAVDGLGMLLEQAAESFFIWHGARPCEFLSIRSLLHVGWR